MKLERKDWPTYLYPHAWAIKEIHVGKTCRSGSNKLGGTELAHAHCSHWDPYPRCICTKSLDRNTMLHETAHILAGAGKDNDDSHGLVWDLTLESIGGAAFRRREAFAWWLHKHTILEMIVWTLISLCASICGVMLAMLVEALWKMWE